MSAQAAVGTLCGLGTRLLRGGEQEQASNTWTQPFVEEGFQQTLSVGFQVNLPMTSGCIMLVAGLVDTILLACSRN